MTGEVFEYRATVRPEWIDYNGHMQDAYYGLVFSHAVDAFQDAVGFDASYRAGTGCTIYLVEDHKYFLSEVTEGQEIRVLTRLIGLWEKRFHLWSEMTAGGGSVAVAEMIQMHVRRHPGPKSAPIPRSIARRLTRALTPTGEIGALGPRARAMGD